MEEQIRYSTDVDICMVWDADGPVRCPTQSDMDTLPVGEDLTEEECELLDD